MTAPVRSWAAELCYVWFYKLGDGDRFGSSEAVDAMLRHRFSRVLAMLAPRPAHEFLGDDHTALAAILLFDQIPRNLFRNSPAAFAHDATARTIARSLIRTGADTGFSLKERQFLYMPLMHSEHILDQQLSLAKFATLPPRYGWRWAVEHHAAIARFGRFPHRNALLGRQSGAAEKAAIEAGMRW